MNRNEEKIAAKQLMQNINIQTCYNQFEHLSLNEKQINGSHVSNF